jgi:hypothetical protein
MEEDIKGDNIDFIPNENINQNNNIKEKKIKKKK